MRFDLIDELASIPDDFADDIAFEWVRLADGMMATSFGLMVERSSIDSFPDIEWLSVGAAKQVNIVSARDITQKCLSLGSVAFKFHESPNPVQRISTAPKFRLKHDVLHNCWVILS